MSIHRRQIGRSVNTNSFKHVAQYYLLCQKHCVDVTLVVSKLQLYLDPFNAAHSLFCIRLYPHSLCRAGGEVNNDIVVEMKTDKANEEAGLLNKRPSTEQVRPLKAHGLYG